MKMEVVMNVVGARRYGIDGDKGAYLFIAEQPEQESPDLVGLSVTKVNCPYEMLDKLRLEKLPGKMKVSCSVVPGAKMSTRLVAHSYVPLPSAGKS